jgi:hypothetical protein
MRSTLNLLLSAMRIATWRRTAGAILTRAAVFLLLILMSIILALTGLGFGLYAAFIWLGLFMSPAAAAAAIGATMVMIAAVVTIIAFRRSRAQVDRPKTGVHAWMPATESIDSLTRSLSQWVQANPAQATAMALVVGFLLGSRR